MQIKKLDREFIEDLYCETNTYNICQIFDQRSKIYKKAKLIYFNLGINPYLKSFQNKVINGYSIIGVSNYEKSYILDNKYSSLSTQKFNILKVINLDLNVLTYLKNIVNNKKLEDKKEFIEYLNYIKKSGYNINMSTALLERVSNHINKKVWSDYILAYVKYDTLKDITENNLVEDFILPESKYMWAKEILDVSVYEEEKNDKFCVIACLVSKAFLLKNEKNDKKKKIIRLLEYSLDELNIYFEFELYLLFKYLMDDIDVQKTFSKIQGISKKTLQNISNISWDIMHVRMAEEQMIDDMKSDKIVFHYIGTKDIGLQNIININPLKIIGFLDDQSIAIREKNIRDVFFDEEMDAIMDKHIKKTNIANMNYKKMFLNISEEVQNLINSHIK